MEAVPIDDGQNAKERERDLDADRKQRFSPRTRKKRFCRAPKRIVLLCLTKCDEHLIDHAVRDTIRSNPSEIINTDRVIRSREIWTFTSR